MPRELIIQPEAEAELRDACDWYESRVQGLGLELRGTRLTWWCFRPDVFPASASMTL